MITTIIKQIRKSYPENTKFDEDMIEEVTLDLESENIICFSVERRSNEDGDYWLQAEYFSQKIGKTIIFDYDYPNSFDSVKELAERLVCTDIEIRTLEKTLSIK